MGSGSLAHDVRFALRSFYRKPGFVLVAVLSLALGIMGTTAMYSVIWAVVLHPFPYKDVDTLMSVKVWNPESRGYRTYYTTDQFLEIAERNTIFEDTIASTISDVLWTGAGEPQRLRGNHVTRHTFQVMGVPPLVGRALTDDDYRAGAPPVCVLGYRFWQRQFGGDRGVLGRHLTLNGTVRTVVGVMPRPFMWRGADVYLPIVLRRGEAVEGVRMVHLLGRLKPNVSEARIEADLRPIIEDLRKREPGQFPEKFRVGVLSFMETFPSGIRQMLWILFGAVMLLLLIACANVSNILLSKAASRHKEMAVRASLGAGRGRLVRQLLTESLMMALAGGALGVGLAFVGLKAIMALVPPGTIPDEAVVEINAPVLLFTLAVSVATAVLFGLAPALQVSAGDLAGALKDTARGSTAGLRQRLLRSGLVVAEVALSLMLLVGAGLMIRSFFAIANVDLGIPVDRLLVMRVPLSNQRYPTPEQRTTFFRELLPRLEALPGIAAVGLNTSMHPFGNYGAPVVVSGASQADTRAALINQVNTGYTKALGIPLLEGRLLSETEIANRQHLALVNLAFVRRYFPERSAVGQIVRIPRLKEPPFRMSDDAFQIAGVLRDTPNGDETELVRPEIYVPYTIASMSQTVIVRTLGEPAAFARAVRSQVYAVDKDQPVSDVRPLAGLVEDWVYSGPRANLVLFSCFAGIGLILAVVGVYGVMSHAVSQRTQEIGVRIALGAGGGNIIGMVLWRGVRLVLMGVALGLGGSLLGARLLKEQVWRISPFDPLSFAAVSLLLLVVALQACFWPARRASRVDPVVALRNE